MIPARLKFQIVMKMMIKRFIILIAVNFPILAVFSQNKDFGIYYGINGEFKLIKKLELDVSANIRTLNNASTISQLHLDGGLTYKFTKIISVGAGFRLTEFFEDDDSFHPRFRWYSELKGKIPLGEFNFYPRIKFQKSYKTYIEDENDEDPYDNLRFRLKILYKTPSFPVNPYIAAETYMAVFRDYERQFEKNRFMAGAEYSISKKHSVELEYMFQRSFVPKLKDRNIISINYNISF